MRLRYGITIAMSERFVFRPPRRRGMIFQLGLALFLGSLGAFSLLKTAQAEVGPTFLLSLLPAGLCIGLIPWVLYRAYALGSAVYGIDRDGLHLQWGLRSEDIPIDSVLWLRKGEQFREKLPFPWFRWPGAVVGVRVLADKTPVEFLAARQENILLIATPQCIYAITPLKNDEFIRVFQQLTEMGSLAPIAARSVYPVSLLSRLREDRAGSGLIWAGLGLEIGLLFWVGLSVPGYSQIVLRYPAQGSVLDVMPGVQLMLLPVLNAILYAANTLLGLFFYRRAESQVAAYILWSSSVIVAGLFLGAIFFILRASSGI